MTTTEVDDTAIRHRALQAVRLFEVRDQFPYGSVEWKTVQQALADLWSTLPAEHRDVFNAAVEHWTESRAEAKHG